MSEQPGHGGRPINNFVEEFFTKLEREKEGSTQWYYRCTFCPNSRLLHQDNRLFRHITTPGQCPNSTQAAREAAYRAMANKKGLSDATVIGGPPSVSNTVANGTHSKLSSFLERPLSQEKLNAIHVQLLR